MRPESELKYLLSAAQTEAVVAVIEGELPRETYGPPDAVNFVRTIYLDTDDHVYFRSSETEVRRRLRVREYAIGASDETPALTGACFLEWKQTRGVVRNKTRVALPSRVLRRLVSGELDHAEWDLALSRMESFKPLLAAIYSRAVRPRLTTWCQRESFCGKDLRVTLDRDVQFCEPELPGLAHDYSKGVARGPDRILEIKVTGEVPDWLQDTLRSQAVTSFSKFRAGMLAIKAARAKQVVLDSVGTAA